LANAGALSFNSVTMRSATFGPTPGVRATCALSRSAIALAKIRRGGKVPSTASAHFGADALHRLQQPKPFALEVAAEAEQFYLVLASHRFRSTSTAASPGEGQRLQRCVAEQCT